MFQRDRDRLTDARKRIDVLPLGSGAIAGSTIVLDRELVARELDFPAITQNSMDAVMTANLRSSHWPRWSLAAVHLSRLSEDLILWASSEFQTIKLERDAFTTGSSLMPQKRTPTWLNSPAANRGGWIGNRFTAQRLQPAQRPADDSTIRDMQEDKEPVFDSLDTIRTALAVFAAMLREAQANPAACAAAVADPMLLADSRITRQSRHPFAKRTRSSVSVALCGEKRCELTQLTLARLPGASPAFAADVFRRFRRPEIHDSEPAKRRRAARPLAVKCLR